MKTLNAYILRELLATVLLTVAVFTFLLLVGNVLSDIFELIASGKASGLVIGKALLLLVPFVLAFSLPIGLLSATLLLFGRLSADQELTAIRASGISPARVAVPVLLVGLAMSAICAVVNLKLAPESRVEFKRLRDSVLLERGASLLTDGRFVDLGNVTLYAQKVVGTKLSGVLIYGSTNAVAGEAANRVRNLDVYAPEAELQLNPAGRPVALLLHNVQGVYLNGGEWQPLFMETHLHPIQELRPNTRAPRISDMSLTELLAERRRLGRDGGAVTPVDVQIQRNLSFSFACLGFSLVGVPLGVRAHRRETNVGIAIALGLLAAYYSLLVLGSALDTQPTFHPALIVWMPTLLFLGVGGALFRRMNRR